MSAITKVFGILKTIIAHHWCGLACFEVVTKTRAPKPTAHRLLETLVRLDYLPYDGETKRLSVNSICAKSPDYGRQEG